MSLDFNVARQNMLDQQIRPWEVVDERVLDAVAYSPREDYVPEKYRTLAFVDMNIPLGRGQVMMAPKLEARLVQELNVRPRERVLEIGTGSGYVTSLLALLGKHVYSVEIFPDFSARAGEKLAAHGIHNVTLETGDAARGWQTHAPYDVILVTGSLPLLPQTLKEQLAPGGRLLAVVGRSPVMDACLVERIDAVHVRQRSLLETDLPPLVNALEPSRFSF